MFIKPSVAVLYSPTNSPFCFVTLNTAPANGALFCASTFLICNAANGLFTNVTTVGIFVFTSTVFGVSSNK